MEKDNFYKSIEEYIDSLTNIKVLLHQAIEFDKQWNKLYLDIRKYENPIFGIKIQNPLLYNTYAYSIFEKLILNFTSFLNGCIENQPSLLKTLDSFTIIDVEKLRDNKNVKLLGKYYNSLTEEEKKEEIQKLKASSALDSLQKYKKYMKSVFPSIDDDYVIRQKEKKYLKRYIKEILSRIKSHRNINAHRFQKSIVKSNNKNNELILETVQKDILNFENILNILSIAHSGISHSFDIPYSYEETITDVIDIILFGSIRSAYRVFSNHHSDCSSTKHYNLLRNSFFNSEAITYISDPVKE